MSRWGRPGERPGAPLAEDELREQVAEHEAHEDQAAPGRPGAGARPRRRPSASTTARAVQSWVDQTIDQAQRQGAFDNLPGAGKPLRDVDTRAEPDWWVKELVRREQLDLSGAMPGVMQLRREKATYPEALLGLPDEAAVRARVEDFNERVLADRRRPHVGPTSPPVVGRLDVQEMVQLWRQARGTP
ncbi:DUF1992 domain-containing protein [uncultured Serinicoccus sp.]|uniref:DnaJ family domain-containing protein n=1 Tax=uncultured Serinicoccus sp. TaxID=735514 RepID=UPI002637F85F|nr:DUF1992 domain-containing protein [uncultured Serinicoccus sp.]